MASNKKVAGGTKLMKMAVRAEPNLLIACWLKKTGIINAIKLMKSNAGKFVVIAGCIVAFGIIKNAPINNAQKRVASTCLEESWPWLEKRPEKTIYRKNPTPEMPPNNNP